MNRSPSAVRRLHLSTFVDTLGSGLTAAVLILFLVQVRGFGPTEVGVVLALAGTVGALTSVTTSGLFSRIEPRTALISIYVGQAVLAALLAVPMNLPGTTAVVTGNMFLAQIARNVRYLVVSPLDPGGHHQLRARLRVVTNVGFGVGASAGGVLAGLGTWAYAPALLLNAGSFLVAACLLVGLPSAAPGGAGRPTAEAAETPGPATLRIGVGTAAALSATLSLNVVLLDVAVPLIVSTNAGTPPWLVGGVLALNTLLVVLFQVRVAARVDGPARILPAWTFAALATATACGLLAVAVSGPTSRLVALVVVAVVAQTLGELWHQAGYFRYTVDVPDRLASAVLAKVNAADAMVIALGPLVVAVILERSAGTGLAVLGVAVLAAGAITYLIHRLTKDHPWSRMHTQGVVP